MRVSADARESELVIFGGFFYFQSQKNRNKNKKNLK